VNIEPRLSRIVSAQPYPLIFATISGAHLYGFPSPDSDYLVASNPVMALGPFVSVSFTPDKEISPPNVYFTGVNLHVVNGTGSSSTINGLGNIVCGYAEILTPDPNRSFSGERSGSHNIVMGNSARYASYNCLVTGSYNTAFAPYACAIGGIGSWVDGQAAVIIGGGVDRTQQDGAVIVGGYFNRTDGFDSVITGGEGNILSGDASYTTILGGVNISSDVPQVILPLTTYTPPTGNPHF
jgi:hypothetical protein